MASSVPGFWLSLWVHRRMVWRGSDLWLSAAIAVSSVVLLTDAHIEGTLQVLAISQLGVAAALLGVVLAGLAIIVVFLNREYLRVLARVGPGVQADLFPFWFTAALAVVTILADAAAIVFSSQSGAGVRRALFGTTTFFFVWTLLAVLSLVAFVAAHGALRATQILAEGDPDVEGGA